MKNSTITKKVLLVFGIIISYYLLDMLLYTGFNYPLLQLNTLVNPGGTIEEFICDNKYTIKVIEERKLIRGNRFELGNKSKSSIRRFRSVGISLQNNLDIKQGLNFSFDLGLPFVKAVAFDTVNAGTQTEGAYDFLFNSNDVSSEDFIGISQCLRENELQIITALQNSDTFGFEQLRAFGHSILINDSIKLVDYTSVAAFTCNDNNQALILDNILFIGSEDTNIESLKRDNGAKIGYVAVDGKIYATSSVLSQIRTKPIAIPKLNCKDSGGQTLESFITTIPNRISTIEQ